MKATLARRRRQQVRTVDHRRRFGLPPTAVRPLFGPWASGRPGASPSTFTPDVSPEALLIYEPGSTRARRLVARMGTSRAVTLGTGARPVSVRAVVAVGGGAVAGMMLAQPFDPVTLYAPVYGLVLGAGAGAAAWRSVKGRGSITIVVGQWRSQLDAIGRIVQNAERIGQPFVSPPGLRSALHAALWHAAQAVGQPGDDDVVGAFDHQLVALQAATESTLVELESPSIEARKAAVSERLAAAVDEISLLPPASPDR